MTTLRVFAAFAVLLLLHFCTGCQKRVKDDVDFSTNSVHQLNKLVATYPAWCLRRTNPLTNQYVYHTVYGTKDLNNQVNASVWEIKDGTIFMDDNRFDECKKGESGCIVSPDEQFFVTLNGSLYDYRRKYIDVNKLDEQSSMSLEAKGKYLSGPVSWPVADATKYSRSGEIFLLHRGILTDCTLVNGPVGACYLYSLEIFPARANSVWASFKPSSSASQWDSSGPCMNRGGTPLQPGGGGGHDPP